MQINLYHFFSRIFSGIDYVYLYGYQSSLLRDTAYLPRKTGVGQSKSKAVIYLRPGLRYGFKITVSHIDIFRVIYIIVRFMERFGRWIIFQGLCKGICKFSRRIADAAEKLCRCTSAFHTALPCHQYGGYPVILRKPAGIHHSADIEYGDYFRETGCYLLHHGFFFLCQIAGLNDHF